MNKLLLHIGLPKTATSALQEYFFPRFHGKFFHYIGLFGPRKKQQTKQYKAIYDYCILGQQASLQKSQDLLKQAKENIDLPSILSDEIFCVDGKIKWQEKFQRLSQVVEGCHTEILLTVREPIEAAFSLYVQNYHIISKRYPDFQAFYSNSNDFGIFHYSELIKHIENCFPEAKLHFIPYELLKENKQEFFKSFFDIFDVACPDNIELPKTNTKKKVSEGTYTRSQGLRDVILSFGASPAGKFIAKIPGAMHLGVFILNHFGNNSFGQKSKRLIPKPTDQENTRLKNILHRDMEDFFNRTGIDYR